MLYYSIFLFILSILIFLVFRLGIGDLLFIIRTDLYLIIIINIICLILIKNNIQNKFCLFVQFLLLFITPFFDFLFGIWRN